ncbi:type II secretion system F family protein [Lactobacillus sp. YT155]|uniref:type II secretion system F family protein n=1 Tax=Lactobacillus sp. YT155 TaxID=3060955 RepID=UPI00265F8E02|nr:type II secretion system F family protein [Lactobacillus sp. YT155]MDO1605054.1 type II secretion system F family protein [Lactobacillus sp. YT155]
MFTLGKLLENGFSLADSLFCLKLKYQSFRDVFNRFEKRLDNGEGLAKSFTAFRLSNLMISQLEIAEKNGLMKQSIKQIGELLKMQVKQLKKLQLLMLYPAFVFVFLLVIMALIKVFFRFDYELTQATIYLEIFDWALIGALIILILLSMYKLVKFKKLNDYQAVQQRINLPIVGSVFQKYYEYNLLFAIGLMIKSGLRISDIVKLDLTGNLVYQVLRDKLVAMLQKGQSLSQFIKQSNLIANELDVLVAAGLSHDQLGDEILILSQLKYDETLEKMQKLIVKIQPLVFIIIAILIINTYLKILLPVYGMMKGMY